MDTGNNEVGRPPYIKTEDDAKLVLKELVSREMNIIGELFVQNMKALDMQPQYTDLDYYLMSNLSDGAIELDLDKKIEETIINKS
jgi:hypothetical protein